MNNTNIEAIRIKASENALNHEFDKMGVKLYVYHFPAKEICSILFGGVTIVSDKRHRKHVLVEMVYNIETECMSMAMSAKYMLKTLDDRGFPGASVCDRRDKFSRIRGRRNAKRRLISHLKRNERR